MPSRERYHWSMGGFGLALAGVGLARFLPSKGWNITAVVAGVLLVLFATGLHQKLTNRMIQAFDRHVRRAHQEDDAATAIVLLLNGGECLSLLPMRSSTEIVGFGFLEGIANRFLKSSAVSTYRRQHRAAIVHAIQAGLNAGAADGGALQLAQDPQSDSDLLALEAKLLKMALELTPSAP